MSSKPFDSTIKELMEGHLNAWPSLVGPWPSEQVDLVNADVSTVTAAADKVFRINSPTGPWILDLEPHSSHEIGVPARLHLYSALLNRRHNLLVRSVLLLLRREANASELTGTFELRFTGENEPYLVFRYGVVRLWELTAGPLLTGSVGMLPLAPLTDDAAARLPAVIQSIESRLRAEVEPVEADKLRTATFVMLGLRYDTPLIDKLYHEVMHMEDSVTYRAIIKKGQLREAKTIVLLLGTRRFGAPTPELTADLDAINSLDDLERLSCRLLEAKDWQDLLAEPVG